MDTPQKQVEREKRDLKIQREVLAQTHREEGARRPHASELCGRLTGTSEPSREAEERDLQTRPRTFRRCMRREIYATRGEDTQTGTPTVTRACLRDRRERERRKKGGRTEGVPVLLFLTGPHAVDAWEETAGALRAVGPCLVVTGMISRTRLVERDGR